jgi:hypothetical protein
MNETINKPAEPATTPMVACYDCGGEMSEDDGMSWIGTKTGTKYHACDDCIFFCEDCSEYKRYRKEEAYTTANENTICSACRQEHYHSCGGCERLFHEDDSAWSYGEDGYCEGCYADRNRDEFPSRDWETDTKLLEEGHGQIVKSNRKFGIELEVNFKSNQHLEEILEKINPNIGLTEDAGAEWQTPPAIGAKAEELITTLCKTLVDKGCSSQNGQGLHVHVDSSELRDMPDADSFNRIQGLWLFYIAFDGVIRRFINKYRRGNADRGTMYGKNTYSFDKVLACKNQQELEALWYACSPQNVNNYKCEQKNGSRYKGFNLHALLYDYHVEIRYHESTLNEKAILEWANLHCKIMDFAMKGIDRAWLERMNKRVIKRKTMFEAIGLSEESTKYFRKKCAE